MVVWGGSGRIAHLNTGGAYVPIDSSDDDGDGYSEADGDGPSACAGDCNDADPTVWVVPGETRGLEFSSDKTILTWSAPLFPGGSLAIYDTLRSPSRSDFLDAGMCLETGGDDTQTPDAETPSQGSGFYYLVRATNACGIGTLGQRSNQDERYGRSCA